MPCLHRLATLALAAILASPGLADDSETTPASAPLTGPQAESAASPATGVTVTLTIENVRSDNGRLLVSICDEANYMNWSKCFGANPYAKKGAMTVTFDTVPPGRYGATAIHDSNMNGRLDMQWYGPPAEPYAYSNDPKPRMGPALFEDIAFDVGDEARAVTITLGAGDIQ